MNNTIRTLVRIALFGVIALSFALLAWWYFFLQSETASEKAANEARGFGVDTPTFSAPEGNTYLNLVRSIPSLPLWRGAKDGSLNAGSLGSSENTGGENRSTLWQASALPVAGIAFVGEEPGILRFVERATGNVLEADIRAKKVARLTNTLVPKTSEAIFWKDRVFLRGSERDAITTETGIVATSTSAKALVSHELDARISSLSVSPKGTLAYLVPGEGGGVSLFVAKEDGKGRELVATLGTSGWTVRHFDRERILLVEHAADAMPGYAYEISTRGVRTPILRAVPGLLVRTHASSPTLLYSTSENGAISTFTLKEGGASPARLPIQTVAEKCAFAPSGTMAYCAVPEGAVGQNFIDRWYRGEMHTNDTWWEVDLTTNTVRRIYEPGLEIGSTFDVELPTVSNDGAHIAFRNKSDGSLWILSLR